MSKLIKTSLHDYLSGMPLRTRKRLSGILKKESNYIRMAARGYNRPREDSLTAHAIADFSKVNPMEGKYVTVESMMDGYPEAIKLIAKNKGKK